MLLMIPLAGLTILAVALIGYLSFHNGQDAVKSMTNQLRSEINGRIEEYLQTFLRIPHQINQINGKDLGRGAIDAENQADLEQHFFEQIQIFDSVTSIYFGNTRGGLANAGREGANGALYVIATDGFVSGPFRKYATDSKGHRTELLTSVPDFDAATRPWYTGALEKNGETWSKIYILFTGQEMAISASYPVYNPKKELLGVVAVDLFLSHLNDFLARLNLGQNGQSFIMEPSGFLIASSTGENLLTAVDKVPVLHRISAMESSVPLTQAAGKIPFSRPWAINAMRLSAEAWLNSDFLLSRNCCRP